MQFQDLNVVCEVGLKGPNLTSVKPYMYKVWNKHGY